MSATPAAGSHVPLSAALRIWVRVALLSFGGPAGQIAVMHRLIVEERKWVSEGRFLHCMSYCMLLPGPEAQQLATYLDWLLHGTRGGLAAGMLFVAPGFLSILLLSVLYAEFHHTTLLEGVFYGIKPAVLAIVLEALLRIGRRALVGRTQLLLALGAFVAIFFFAVPFPWIIACAAAIGFAAHRASGRAPADPTPATAGAFPTRDIGRPSAGATLRTLALWGAIWFAPVALLRVVFGPHSVFLDEAWFFSKTAMVTFGGAYAVLSYIAQQAVHVFGWLVPGEMLDGLGMAETTPGPLIQVVQFVGYMAAYRNPGSLTPLTAGVLGSVVTAWVTFAPCFLFVFAGAPFAESMRSRPALRSALAAVTSAIVGVILNLTLWFSMHTVFADLVEIRSGPFRFTVPVWTSVDPVAALLAAGAGLAVLRWRAGMGWTLGGAAALGLAWRLLART